MLTICFWVVFEASLLIFTTAMNYMAGFKSGMTFRTAWEKSYKDSIWTEAVTSCLSIAVLSVIYLYINITNTTPLFLNKALKESQIIPSIIILTVAYIINRKSGIAPRTALEKACKDSILSVVIVSICCLISFLVCCVIAILTNASSTLLDKIGEISISMI